MKYENGEYIIYDMAGKELWRGRSLANLSGANLRRANLSWANLSSADLRRANLRWANLSEANLRRANLSWANLRSAGLSGADLRRANLSSADLSGAGLSEANLREANLREANLSSADLSSANLSGAYLRRADLSGADLTSADLRGADLSGTCLDPALTPNADAGEFGPADMDGWVYGYRTRATSAAGRILQDDRIYGTEVFSIADTECHPGWYLWPTLQQCKDYQRVASYVRVRARICDIHKAGNKWRTRAIWVIGAAE